MHDTPRQSPSRARRLPRRLATIAVAFAAAWLSLGQPGPPAAASTHGAGEYDGGHWHGSYIEDGQVVYCLNYHLSWDGGAGPAWAGTATSYGALSPAQLAGIGAAVAWSGQTSDPAEARAVADAIWYVTDGIVPWGPTAARAQQVIDWIAAWVAAPSSGTVELVIDASGPTVRDGLVAFGAIAPAVPVTGMIQLTNAVFVESGADTMTGTFDAGDAFEIRGLPTTGAPYRVGATFTGTSTLSTLGAAVPLYGYGAGYQTMAGPAAPAIIPVTGAALDAQDRGALTLTTRTVSTAPAGSAVRDTASIGDLGAGIDLTGWSVGFELYEFADGVPVCTPTTRVHTSAAVPIAAAGDVDSDAYVGERPGSFGWVATLYDPSHVPLLVGECGEPTETFLLEPVLATTGDARGAVGPVLAVGLTLAGSGFLAAAVVERRRLRRR